MRALAMTHPDVHRAEPIERDVPAPGSPEIRVRVTACGVCRTDLHVVDGELTGGPIPIVPGHEIVGRVEQCGDGVTAFEPGARVGIPWLGWSCGECGFCRAGRENLCRRARYTGYQIDGGFAAVSYTHLRAHETPEHLVCRLLLEKKKKKYRHTQKPQTTRTHQQSTNQHTTTQSTQ